MRPSARRFTTFLSAAAVACASLAVSATASAATAAPGAPIRIQAAIPLIENMPRQLDAAICTQGPVGTVIDTDGTARTVMLTAAHCTLGLDDGWEPTSEVFVPRPQGDELIGYREAYRIDESETGDFVEDVANFSLGADWAVVELEEGVTTSRLAYSVDSHGRPQGEGVVLTGIRDYRDLGHHQISADNFGQPICKEGTTSGRSCGVQLFRSKDSVFSYGLDYQHGDSGGINYDPDTGEAIGMTAAAYGPIGHAQAADAALQGAYGIPDGEVNERFTLAESTEPHDEYRTVAADGNETAAWMEANAPAPEPEPAPAPAPVQVPAAAAIDAAAAQLDNFHGQAQQLADQAANQVAAGDLAGLEATAGQAAQTVNGHIDALTGIALGS